MRSNEPVSSGPVAPDKAETPDQADMTREVSSSLGDAEEFEKTGMVHVQAPSASADTSQLAVSGLAILL